MYTICTYMQICKKYYKSIYIKVVKYSKAKLMRIRLIMVGVGEGRVDV